MMQSLPVSSWPMHDPLVWAEACRPTQRLRLGGLASHMKPVTQDDLARRYGYFLWALMQARQLDPAEQAGAQIVPDTLEHFISLAEPHWSSVTLYQSVYKLRRIAEILAPETSFAWLREIEADLRAAAHPARRRENVTTDELVEAGEALFREAGKASHLKPKEQARRARNGLMIALLALRPIRHRNFSELTLGSTFRHLDGNWWIVLEAGDTKAGRIDEKRVPQDLVPLVERYLTVYRPILLTQKDKASREARKSNGATRPMLINLPQHEAGALWISVTGVPLTYSAVGAAIVETTEATLGIRLSPHAFRRAAKATATFLGGAYPGLARGVLQHNGDRVGEENYDSSSSRRAALESSSIVRDLTR
ncbi:site-specific integrase [Microvirga sp. VF16]|uniref:site-specific integrase n=1 Tax=Microvirga sp. VF16 TaxID=2807101 RepID=UPI00193E9956|nr:site-specific integrase [Microvirga sp. VF16]QRM33576.1 site-specific integrase [Microvirga sp. VF16]